jgi:hypothetical protein
MIVGGPAPPTITQRMEAMEACVKRLEVGYLELRIALEGPADRTVWRRPADHRLGTGALTPQPLGLRQRLRVS